MDRQLRTQQRSEDWRRLLLQHARQSELVVLPPKYKVNKVNYVLVMEEDPGLQRSYEDGAVCFNKGRPLKGYKTLEIELQLYSDAYEFFKSMARNHCQHNTERVSRLRRSYDPPKYWWQS